VAIETSESGAPLRVWSLLLVFVLAKVLVLSGHSIAWSIWTVPAYLWQDAVVVLLFALYPRLGVYWALVMYVAINVPVARVLSTPLTATMLRGARGALADSIFYYATFGNLAAFAAVLIAAALLPALFRKAPIRGLVVAMVSCVVAGLFAVDRLDTLGLERNAWTALAGSLLPKSPTTRGDWRVQGFDQSQGTNLSWLSAAAAGRNVVMVSLESTGAQYLGLYGTSPDPMPNLSKLAATGVVFDNAYAVYPESIKGLFSVLCSRYPAFDVGEEQYAKTPCAPLSGVLQEAGYRTALFHSGRFLYLGMEAVIRDRGYQILADAGEIGGNHNSSFGVDEEATVDKMLAWLDALTPGERFFLTYLPIAGHHPYVTPKPGPFAAQDDLGHYRNALHYGDQALGRLRDALVQRGLDEKTLWVIYGDHGEAFGQHEGNFGHTFHLYQENVHVPFVIALPGWLPKQERAQQTVSLIDTAPTVLELLGMRPPTEYQGISMLDGTPRMALFFADYSKGLLGLRDGSRKVIYDVGSARVKVFEDRQEREDVAGRDAIRDRWYVDNLKNWSAAQTRALLQQK